MAKNLENSSNLSKHNLRKFEQNLQENLYKNLNSEYQNSFKNSLEIALKNLPESPGIYQYFNASNRLLYVGKAKNLKHRVRSYFSFSSQNSQDLKVQKNEQNYQNSQDFILAKNEQISSDFDAIKSEQNLSNLANLNSQKNEQISQNFNTSNSQKTKQNFSKKSANYEQKNASNFSSNLVPNPRNSLRIQRMIAETSRLEIITTSSEADALILENSFIKQLRPKYNILLRDDKTYPYIYVDLSEDFPRFELTRKIIKRAKVRYFGPFFKGARELLNALYLNFTLRQKKACKKACIFHQIGRCEAPCEEKISKKDYDKILQSAINSLLNPHLLLRNLENKMQIFAKNESFEEAARVRDMIKVIRDLEVKIHIDIAKLEDFHVFGLACERGILGLTRFVVQEGKIISANNKIFTLQSDADFNELYKQILLENFSVDEPLNSTQIYILEDFEDRALIEEILSKKFGKKFKISVAKIGEKRRICELARANAVQNIKNQNTQNQAFLRTLQDFFELENLPENIEIFDNSHMQGVANVGAMVFYAHGEWDKSRYRRYHLTHTNEFEQMKELLTRRAKDFEILAPPDLWLIDGGEVLLNLAKNILEKVGANVDVMAIAKEKVDAKAHRAKGGARDILHTSNGAFALNLGDEKLLFMQKLRDEAHRFAISFHQNTKRKADLQSSKLRTLGVSDGQISKLLKYFGSFEAIYKASFEELKNATNSRIAEKIFEKFGKNLT